jgi:CheY-like chemotaxis protein
MMSILVADDAPSVRKLLRTILEVRHTVIEAEDGKQAFDRIVEHRPAVAILDVTMPEMTGIEVCRRVREDPTFDETSIVVITANGSPSDRAAALEAGGNYFLTKPFSPTAVQRLIEAILAKQTLPSG